MQSRERLNLCFDLDGTLIDSAQSIKEAVEQTFEACSVPIIQKISVGPTLDELINLQQVTDKKIVHVLKKTFKSIYDQKLCTTAVLYPGVKTLLENLFDSNCNLTLVTNKRIRPTLKILDFYEISHLFSTIVGCDSYNLSKSESLKRLRFGSDEYIYVGDTYSDYVAATESDYRFLFASWGYGTVMNCDRVNYPHEIFRYLGDESVYFKYRDASVSKTKEEEL